MSNCECNGCTAPSYTEIASELVSLQDAVNTRRIAMMADPVPFTTGPKREAAADRYVAAAKKLEAALEEMFEACADVEDSI